MSRVRTTEQKKALREYDLKHYKLVQIKPKVQEAEILKAYVQERGESLTRFLVRAAMNQIQNDAEDDIRAKKFIEVNKDFFDK